MSTYSHPISIRWGAGAAPSSVRVIDSTGTAHTPALTTAITEAVTSSGVYIAVATWDTSWGVAKDYWLDASGVGYPGDGPLSLVTVNGVTANVDSTLAQNVSDLKKVAQSQDD
jgi:hypothetical protein